ncbi:MAG: DegV family protein [Caldilineaceae bacterium]|nr:DegV family protein [Caldilineaceae bacterium]
MSQIAIITDSTCTLPTELVERYQLIITPCQVRIGEDVYREGVDLTAQELFQRMFSSQSTPATSLPSGEDYAAAFEEAQRRGARQVLGLFVGSGLSGTFNGARLAAQDYDLEVELVDSGTTSLALGLLVLEAARRVEAGGELAQIAESLRAETANLEAYALLNTLEFVRRGGRIGRVGELIANVLNIKPILRVAHNSADVAARTRSHRKGLAWLTDTLADAAPVRGLGLIYTSDEAKVLAEGLLPDYRQYVVEGGDILLEPASAAIAVHTGPNSLGLLFIK